MKIIQFGLQYSPNLGDGIIAECIVFALRQRLHGAEVLTVDLSGRQGFGQVTLRNRSLAIRVLKALPLGLRQRVVLNRLGRMMDAVSPRWETALDGAALAIIGGGQLFSDADLNFCIKIARAADLCAKADVPVAIYAVGASKNWTPRGKRLFARVFETRLRFVGLRDASSAAAWRSQTDTSSPAPEITRDPGLLAASCFGEPTDQGGDLGICITAPEILTYHADAEVAGTGRAGLAFYRDLIGELADRGHRLNLFTNGAEEDRAALAGLLREPEVADLVAEGRVQVAVQPETPGELARLIGGFRAVIAHRLHALIVAFSYGRPIVGLGWDRKVESFLASVNARPFFAGTATATGKTVADIAEAALEAGIDAATHKTVLAETWDGIDRMLAANGLSAATPRDV